jgi:hypothetical protein
MIHQRLKLIDNNFNNFIKKKKLRFVSNKHKQKVCK